VREALLKRLDPNFVLVVGIDEVGQSSSKIFLRARFRSAGYAAVRSVSPRACLSG
jgi:hypothetical protein